MIENDVAVLDARLREFHRALREAVLTPHDAAVVGERVSIIGIEYAEGRPIRGVRATCRRADGSRYTVAACDVQFPAGSVAARIVNEIRAWLGLEPFAAGERELLAGENTLAACGDAARPREIELAILAVKRSAARCRIVGEGGGITLRTNRAWHLVPGEIARVRADKEWRHAGHAYVSGEVVDCRRDIPSLGLVPLRLEERGLWRPDDHYWGEVDEPLEEWAVPIAARGPRPAFEMEQVIPGFSIDDPESDAILESVALRHAGDVERASAVLMKLLATDLRCLDAHAHLGNLELDHSPERAIRHYEVGVRIGEQSFGGLSVFDGLLPWGAIDNRPFLRCLHGYGLALWRLERPSEAASVFDRLLWLSPTDNLGVRFLIDEARAGTPWSDEIAGR